jgi:hypothetical protein
MPDAALSPLSHVDPAEAWKPWEPNVKQPWDLKWAGHLYRRAAFGANLRELREAVRNGLPATLDRLLCGDPKAAVHESLFQQTGVGVAGRNNPFELRSWWLYWLMHSLHPLREKIVLFWHNHFATSVIKVQRTVLMHKQNELLRKHALGKFYPFLLDMSRDPAMLIWLDSNSNVKGKPNENYARELMELFSLGVGQYTEPDIREAARAFTGWHTQGDDFAFEESLHDFGDKTVLGQTGAWDGGDIVRIVLEQPAASRFLVRKLYRYLISETADPPDSLLQPLADAFRKSDYDIGALVEAMLRSRHFFSDHAYRQRVKSPVEFVLGATRAMGQNLVQPRALATRLEAMGQQLFAPPNVKGWEGGRSWLNNATVLARHNFAQALALGQINLADPDPTRSLAVAVDPAAILRLERITEPEPTVALLADLLLDGILSTAARARFVAFVTEGNPQGDARDQRIRETVHAIMTMPEYQLA